MRTTLLMTLALAVLGLVGAYHGREAPGPPGWKQVQPGVWRSDSEPASYALVAEGKALLVDASVPPNQAPATVERILLTHHHRDSTRYLAEYRKAGIPVQASKEAEAWLSPEGVSKYWKESLPLRGSRTAYLVLAEGVAGVDYTLEDGKPITWRGWKIEPITTPGHSRDHLAFVAQNGDRGKRLLFSGDTIQANGSVWSPYTTDWDHWTDAGLTPLAKSLARLAEVRADVLYPARGASIDQGLAEVLSKGQKNAEEMAFLKSFERFTKQRLKDEPKYAFLAKEQAESNGSKPWSKVSQHLWLTGNTYVLTSKDGGCLVMDPWDPNSARQLPKLQQDEKVGKVEVVLCSHAHFDHYDGWYSVFERDKGVQMWTLDRVAEPLEKPFLLRAPFLDSRPIQVDRKFRDGEKGRWREYEFRFHFLPGQTEFTMGVETTIDGKRCFFTADNWFHQDQFSGSGGWMGLNRSSPLPYSESAAKVLAAKPEWVLAEHGGPFEFHPEDWRRRVEWGKVAAKAADALSPSGDHRHDWNPHAIRIEPVRVVAKAGAEIDVTLVVTNVRGAGHHLDLSLTGRILAESPTLKLMVPGASEKRVALKLKLRDGVAPGRHVLPVWIQGEASGADAFLAVDVE